MKPDAYLKITKPPHLLAEENVLRIYCLLLLSLLPVAIAYLWFDVKLYGLRIIACLAATFLAEVVAVTFFRSEKKFYGFHSAWLALLLCFIPYANTEVLEIGFAVFLMLVFGRDVFGGIGSYPLNPVFVGYLILRNMFPSENGDPILTRAAYMEVILWAGVIAGALFLLSKRLIRWELPVLFLAVFSTIRWVVERAFAFNQEWIVVVFASFFVLTDYSTMPSTFRGRQWMALAMGVCSGVLSLKMDLPSAMASGVLIGNSITPWIEDRSRPFGSQRLWQNKANKIKK